MALAAMTHAQTASLRPATVQFTHLSEAAAFRLNDECWVPPSTLKQWGWNYRMVSNEVSIDAEGKSVRVTGRAIEGKFLLPMDTILKDLGGSATWKTGADVWVATGQVRSIRVREGEIRVDGTLSMNVVLSHMENPGRLVVDLKGARLNQGARLDLDASARVGQYSPDTVRLVIQTNDRPQLEGSSLTQSLRLKYRPEAPRVEAPKPTEIVTDPPKTQVEPPKTDASTQSSVTQGTQPPLPDQPGIAVWAQVGPMSVVNETERVAQYRIELPMPISGPIRFSRIDPVMLQISVPRAHYVLPPAPLNSPSLAQVNAVEEGETLRINLRMARPMGVEFSQTPNALLLTFTKPNVGNGKLVGKTIVLDPGHGGRDSGARSPKGSVFEKDIVLNVSRYVAQFLTSEGATVIRTRSSDVFIPLGERSAISNRNNADFFLSVHVNSNKVANTASGSITFYHGGKPMGELLASCIENEIKKVSQLPSMGVWSDRRIYSSGFAVLRNTRATSVLIELGFINNDRDRARLIQEEYQVLVARAIVRGMKVYLGDANP